MPENMICPRRAELISYENDHKVRFTWEKEEPQKILVQLPPEPDTWVNDLTCSFCGSLRPSLFLQYAREGQRVIPTDKTYKVYIRDVNQQKCYFQHFSEEEKREFINLVNEGELKMAVPGYFYVLPFFCKNISSDVPFFSK